MKICYIAGPFRGPTAWDVECNIRHAEKLALEAWRAGFAVICPHTNTRFFNGAADDAAFLEGDLEILRRCDCLLTTSNWKDSVGARAEVEFAYKMRIPVYHSIYDAKKEQL